IPPSHPDRSPRAFGLHAERSIGGVSSPASPAGRVVVGSRRAWRLAGAVAARLRARAPARLLHAARLRRLVARAPAGALRAQDRRRRAALASQALNYLP